MSDNIKILDKAFVGSLTETEQGIFLAHRNSLLFLFGKDEITGDYDDEILEIAESSSKVFINLLPEVIKNPPPPQAASTTM